jgi:hypothetical protein
MTTLLLRGTLPDVADFVYEVSEDSLLFGMFLCFFILFASLTVMNMLVGVLCEVVTCVSSVEKEQLVVNFVQAQLSKLLHEQLGQKLDAPMSKTQFLQLLGRPQAARTLHEVGVDVLGLMEISDFLFKEEKELSFPEFMGLVLELRGSNTATVKHIVDLQKFFHMELQKTFHVLDTRVSCIMEQTGASIRIRNDPHRSKTEEIGAIKHMDSWGLVGLGATRMSQLGRSPISNPMKARGTRKVR